MLNQTEQGSIKFQIDSHGVATITLCREEKHNAFDDKMFTELIIVLNEIAQSSAKVLILAAKGKSFSAGADLNWIQRMVEYGYEESLQDAQGLALIMKTLNEMPMTTIAKIDGAAFGGAVGLVCCCDIAIGSEKSRFSLTEVKFGLIPSTISPYVVAAIGQRAARRFFQTAEIINAKTALRIGLLSELTTSEQLDEKTNQLVELLLNNSPKAVRAAKKMIIDVQGKTLDDELIQDTVERMTDIRASKEGQEGLSAFLEKRRPSWSNDESEIKNFKQETEN